MTIIVQPFKPEHLNGLKHADLPHMPVIPQSGGPAYTGFIHDKVACCGGIVEFWPGVGEAWFILGEVPQENRGSLFKAVYHVLRKIIAEYKFRRIQASVLESFEVGHRFVKRLGFTDEGVMRKYGPNGVNFRRYALIAEDE